MPVQERPQFQAPPGGYPQPASRGGVRAGWALGLGIAAFVLAWIPVFGALLAAVALLLAILDLVAGNRGSKPVWATVLGGIALLIGVLVTSAIFSVGNDIADATSTTVVEEPSAPSGDQKAESDQAATKEEPTEEPAEEEPAVAGIGDPVRDGKFEFTVTKVEDGVAEIGDEYFGKKAQGQFVLVHLTVENIGDQSQTFFGDNVSASDAEMREFSSDTEAAIYLDESNSFINEINPGNSTAGIVVFDVPKDVKLTALELHDSAFSGGVAVSLG
ncbi:DUF4352 domain-containing protein [Promicromonospora thailandica]|uniref:DUF4352 domain-containing protein n=1 Tax=Promicromonospora thailandica TaxID=765201 RepID=UPI0020A4E433|nr:DUF4352 domain-containing protein [Promicromonospora thailandica]BFF21267.1 hypothetical protein GCM10025730_47880 [Promicromonospora thailandica]